MKHFKPGQLITVKSHDLPNIRIVVRVLANPKDTKLFNYQLFYAHIVLRL